MKQDNFSFDTARPDPAENDSRRRHIVIIAGPTTDLFAPEIEALNALRREGRQGNGHARSAAERDPAASTHAVSRRLGHQGRIGCRA
jgi:hypothetical protein